MIRCWPVFTVVKKAGRHHHPIVAAHRHHRRARRIRRAIGWTCIAVSGLGAAIAALLLPAPRAAPQRAEMSSGLLAYYPPESETWKSPEFFTLPPSALLPPGVEIIGPPVLLPDLPQPVEEPSSLAVLAAAVVGFFASAKWKDS